MDPQEENMQLPTVQPSSDDAVVQPGGVGASSDSTYQQTTHAQPSISQPSSTGQTPMTADDIDLIEKEWVEKAKTIVNDTMGDPHSQSEAINKMKADYIKKRYNKDIKSEEK